MYGSSSSTRSASIYTSQRYSNSLLAGILVSLFWPRITLGQTITRQPPSKLIVVAGQTLSVPLVATGAVNYKWLKGDQTLAEEVEGQNTATFSLTNVQASQGGSYICRVSEPEGTIYSIPMQVVVRPSMQRLYVSGFGAGLNDGSSWNNSLKAEQLQANLSNALPGQEVWVLQGIFRPTFGTDRTASFVIPAGVQVYGGFIGSETNPNQRPLFTLTSSNRTTLSGNIDFNGDNDSYHVIRLSNGNEHTRLDGFVVADGKATGSPDTNDNIGGGIYTESNRSSNLTIANCQFQHNTATSGGAIHISNETGESTINLINCLFSNNKAVGLSTGGAMLIRGNVKYRLINCLFVGNTSQFIGGAVACFGSNPGVSEFVNCTFTGNAVTTPYFDDGSATIYLDPSSTTRLNNCLIWGNSTGITSNGQVTYTYSNSQDFVQPGVGNRSIDPHFVDAANGNFQLQSTSPLINAGDPASTTATVGNTDLAGGIRISSGRVDIGAFEYQSALPTSTPIALAGVSVSPNPVCAGKAITVSATVNNVSGPYTFTLTNGLTSLSGSATSAAFSQSVTASGAGLQTYTLVVANGSETSSATASVTVKPKPSPPTVELLPAAVVCNTEMEIYFPASGNLINFSVFDATGRQVRYTGDPIPSGGAATVSEVGQFTLVATAVLNGCLSDPMPPVNLTINPAPDPIGSFAANGSISCSQSIVTLTASSPTPGLHYVFAGPGVFSQSGNSAVVSQAGIYSVTGTIGGGCSVTASTTVTGTTQPPAAPTLTASATSTSNQPISVTANGCSGTLNWNLVGVSGAATGAVYTLTTPGVYTLTASCTVSDCTGPSSVPVVLTITPAATGPLTLLAPTYTCATGAITFRTQGGNGSLIEYFAIGITSWTTNPNQTVEAGLRGDPKLITLKARQRGSEVSYLFNLAAACSSTNPPPTSGGLTLLSPIYNCSTGAITFRTEGGNNSPIEYFAIGISSWTTNPDQTVEAGLRGDPKVITLNARQRSTADDWVEVTLDFDLRAACDPASVNPPANFTITGVTVAACEQLSAGERRLTFTPQYSGLTNQPVVFSVPNEMSATMNRGPYVLKLYTDNPTILLQAKQGQSLASYRYNWLGTCLGSARQAVAELAEGLQVSVLGNPVEGLSVELEIRSVAGLTIELTLTDIQGRLVHQRHIDKTDTSERVSLPIGPHQGILLLQVNTPEQRQQFKVLKL